MRGILIRHNGWWSVEDPKDEEELKRLLGAQEIERPALKMGTWYYGCACDADARDKNGFKEGDETVVMMIRKMLRTRFFGYIAGDVFIYLNKGLDDDDIERIKRRIFLKGKDRTPFLVVDDFQNYEYEEADL